jgi:hypothetical protein
MVRLPNLLSTTKSVRNSTAKGIFGNNALIFRLSFIRHHMIKLSVPRCQPTVLFLFDILGYAHIPKR